MRFQARGTARDVANTFACTSFGHGHHEPIWRCQSCGLMVQWPMPTADALIAEYGAVADPVYEEEKDSRYRTFSRVARVLGPANDRRLLDVGAYCGYFVDVARQAGFRAEGLELSSWAAGRARSLGLNIHQETLATRAESDDTYDVVTMWDVIEHLSDPLADLEAAHSLLRPGGEIYLSTIDAGSRLARVMGRRWPWLMDMHLFYFDVATLSELLRQAGFEVTKVARYTHVVSGKYLAAKLSAAFPGRLAGRIAPRLVPRRLHIPVQLGDNMLIAARRGV